MAYGNYAPFYRGGYFNPMQAPIMTPISDNQNQFTQQQPYQAPAQIPLTATHTPSNDMIFVLGQNEAESYPVAPNATVTMWDKNQKTFYIKTANAQGIPSMQIYDFTERVETSPKTPTEHTCQCGDKFAEKKEVTELQKKYDEFSKKLIDLEKKMESFSEKQNNKKSEEK